MNLCCYSDKFTQKGSALLSTYLLAYVRAATCEIDAPWLPASASKCKRAATRPRRRHRAGFVRPLSRMASVKLPLDSGPWCVASCDPLQARLTLTHTHTHTSTKQFPPSCLVLCSLSAISVWIRTLKALTLGSPTLCCLFAWLPSWLTG